MWALYKKEIQAYFNNRMAYLVLILFFLMMGLLLWVFPQYSLLDQRFAQLNSFFDLLPYLFVFIIPALCMSSIAEERQMSTIDLLYTSPRSITQIVGAKFLAAFSIILLAIVISMIYYVSMNYLARPSGNLDHGAIRGSYVAVFFLAMAFTAISIFGSAITQQQLSAFLLSAFLCFFLFYGFYLISELPIFYGKFDEFLQWFGMEAHFFEMSKGVLYLRDICYFLSLSGFFFYLAVAYLKKVRGHA